MILAGVGVVSIIIISSIVWPPQVSIYAFTLSSRLATSGSNSTAAEPPPLAANCTIAFAFANNRQVFGSDNSGVLYEYDEIEVSVAWDGRNETLMRANLGTFLQDSLQQKPVLRAVTDIFVLPDLQWAEDYTFTVNVKARVRAEVRTEHETAFYTKATCDEVKIGIAKTQSADMVGVMLNGPQRCWVAKLKSGFYF
ncbi:unnamed protein product [Cuscuta europaea]|uniref:Uncharacterized protein n=1 Tax=Cuscuta europaea TaxID=41803 RepID=A0A9P0YHG9_CUSEU|nr:unnamed protein product [Cuscuta europaea]